MKCLACSAVNQGGASFCEYCGTALSTKLSSIAVESLDPGSRALTPEQSFRIGDYLPSAEDPAFHLWNTALPKSSFKWWAFFFPVAYLGGYGAKKSAVAVAVSILVAALFFAVVQAVSYRAATFAVWGLIGFVFVISYKVAVHSERLIGTKPKFNYVPAIALQLVYVLLYSALV